MRLLLVLLVFISSDLYAFAMGDAINMAGRQRMLSQRITQTYILQGIQPGVERHQQVFTRSLAEFERNLQTLEGFADAAPVRDALVPVRRHWQQFREVAGQPVSKFTASELFRLSNVLLPAAHAYVVALENLANHSSAELVNVSGRQRMLSQRIAKNYVAEFWGVSGDAGAQALYEDLAEFEHMLEFLLQSPYNTPDITRNLRKTQGHLKYASRGFDGEMKMSEERQIHVVTGTTDIMLRNMNIITGQYAEVFNAIEVASQ